MPKTSEPFCRVIHTGNMEVDFTVLENELPLLKVGDKVEITPYASAAGVRQGSISEINPLVDENGMVRIKARVNGSNKLFDGMNVRVGVKRSVGEQLVIPKTAVVLRSGKQVVFTLKEGKAMWNYVHTGLENMEEYTITDGLEEGMEVITTGNVNLAHEAPVRVIKIESMVKFLLQRPIAVLMAFTACFIVGLVTYFSLPVSLLPDIAIPQITIQMTGENSSARELENTVVTPVRRQLLQVAGLREIKVKPVTGRV